VAVEEFPVEKGAILMFARAVGDTNPIYYDEAYAKGTEVGSVIAPPTFVQSSAQFDPDYPLRPKPGQKWFGSGRTPSGLSDAPATPDGPSQPSPTQQPPDAGGAASSSGSARNAGSSLHAEQEFTYHRPIHPGDVLSATVSAGERWEKQGRSGRLEFAETITEYRDKEGNLVVTARGVGVRTAGPVTKGAK
jgi:acyl dehydratase